MDPGPNGRLDLSDVTKLEALGDYSQKERRVARRAGMYAWDLARIHNYCFNHGLILVFRTNRLSSRSDMLRFDAEPKSATVKAKTGGGVVNLAGHLYYSDYDLMSVWQENGKKVNSNIFNRRFNNHGIKYDRKALDDINSAFCTFGQICRIQHGANDDYYDAHWGAFLGDKNVHPSDDFVIAGVGATPFIKETMAALHRWYRYRGFTSDLEMQTQDGRYVPMKIWPYHKE